MKASSPTPCWERKDRGRIKDKKAEGREGGSKEARKQGRKVGRKEGRKGEEG